jgi:SDR family mycofactocin-dependent oxidoreductase
MGMLDGRVALVTGAARGQGRSHAVRLAQEGADIIAIDLCQQIDSVPYPLATEADLEETLQQVKALGRRIEAKVADVRDRPSLSAAVDSAVAELGRLDIVSTNAGIAPLSKDGANSDQAWQDVIDVNLTGTFNTIQAALPGLRANKGGGSIVLTSSTAGLKGNLALRTFGGAGYGAAKHGVIGLVRIFATELAEHSIRVNAVLPTGVNTPMGVSEAIHELIADSPELGFGLSNLLPGVELVEPIDISNAVLWLVSDAARYVTGVVLPVDAGFSIK